MDVTYLQGPSPCHRYQQKLKSETQKISERSWIQSKAVLFNKETSLSYTSLVLDTQGQASPSKIKKSKIKKSRKVRTKKLKAYIPEDKQETSPSELLKTYERKILLVGKPGTGKTAVVHQMLKLWSEKDNKDLDYMFYFDMRETPNITEVHKLEDLLFSVFNEPDEGKDKVLEDIKNNADNVTIIFDGVTDIPSTSVVFKLIQKTLLPEAKIIITCRPEVESADFLLGWDCLRVEVKGFSEQGIREYLSKYLSEEHFNKVLCNLELFSLCHVPMYALMVVACFSFEGSEFSPHPCTVTEIYLNILHFCIQRNVCKTSENESTKWDAVLSLSEAAFCATEGKNVNLKSLPKLESCAYLAFLSRSVSQVSSTAKKPLCAFLHYTVQEFFAALWVLKDPERTRSVVQQCLTDNIKHMKHLVPFLCGLLNDKNTDLLESLIPSQQLRETSGWFFKHLVTTFVDRSDTEDCEIDLLFLCQCLYESQSAEACVYLLDKLDYCLDLSGETLDPQQCYAVSYIISQSKERKIQLNLEKTKVSKQGIRPLLGCLSKLQSFQLSWQLWTICLLSEVEVDYISLLCFAENQLHLSVNSQPQLYDQAGKVLQKSAEKVKVCLHWDHRSSVDQSVSEFLLQFLPNIHSLSVDTKTSDEDRIRFFVNLFCAAAEREQQTGEKILELLSSVCRFDTFPVNERDMDDDLENYQCDFLLDLCSHVKDCETKTGLSVLPSLQSVFQSAPAVWSINLSERKTSILLEVLKLQPEKKQVELTGCSHEESEVRSFLQCLPYISQLRLSIDMSLLLFQWVRRGRVVCPLAVEELSLVPKKARPSQRVMLRAVSSLASLLRYWTVGRLDLTESCIPAQGLITLLLHDGPLTVKLSEESFQQLLCLLHEIQDKDLTLSFFSKVGGDLTSCCLNWELLHYLLQQASAQTITVNLRKNLFLQEETTRLLPFLDRIVFKRPSPSFVMSSIRELYRAHDSHAVPSLLRSLGHVINLSCRELDSVDCAALIFILKHGDRVKLNLLWTSIPAEGAESILFMLDNVSHLSVDRNQLLRFIHCCAACDVQQEAASGLLRTLQHSLDLSCSSCVELPEEDQPEPLSLTADDCRAVSTILTHSSRDTQLDLRDCEVEDSVLDLLFPVLHRVRLRVSKTVLVQLLSLVPVNSERDTVRRAVSLCRALGGELDLSHSTLDQRVCGALVQMLDSCEGLTELDLSHCQLTDQLLLPLITHLHKVQVLDLSHNQITDASTDVLLQLLSINPSIDCVRLYSNNIVHRAAFKEHKQFEICLSHNQITDASTDVLLQLLSINPSIDCVRSEEEQTKELEVEMLEIQAAASSIDDSEVKPGPTTPDINPKDVKKLPSSSLPEVKNECCTNLLQ
ncbi:uncharacterized protein LOC102294079 [Haplochromis burtoni]|uniref:uncharacterized protein LOC102294079 n=1 Tax=Haplochromis burtoni TaxID=8153 RepID=UPI001C2D70D3|nr:uncharacterized protein LOC102294079 [Haplochromis burtoni]